MERVSHLTTRTPVAPVAPRNIVTGPELCGFLQASLKGTTSTATFTIETALSGGALRNARGIDVNVTITDATPEDGSGLRFIFGGTWQRPGRHLEGQRRTQRVEGYYDTVRKTGWIRPLN